MQCLTRGPESASGASGGTSRGRLLHWSMLSDKAESAPRPRDPVVEAYKKDVDRTLLIESLKLTVEQRIDRLQAFMNEVEALRAGLRR
jgi:hypothetical protein